MILSSELANLVAAGTKTRITRPRNRKGKLTVGQSIPIQRKVTERKHQWTDELVERRETKCHVKITALFECEAHELDDVQARAEGFKNRAEFFDWWRDTYGIGPLTDPSLGDPVPTHIEVVVVCVKVIEQPRFMAPGHFDELHIPADEHGYMRSATRAIDPLEAVDKETLDNQTAEAQRIFGSPAARRERAQERERKQLAQRLTAVQHRARMQGTDLGTDLRVVRERVERMERKTLREEAA